MLGMATKKLKLKEEEISKILVADTHSESGAEVSDVEEGNMTTTHATVRHLTCRVEGLGHKLFLDNFFSSPRLFDDLDGHKTNSCWTVRPNRKDMPRDFGPRKLKLKRGDVRVKTRGGLAALVWKDR